MVTNVYQENYYVGTIGLSGQAVSFAAGDANPDLLQSFYKNGSIPSISYGYLAGSAHFQKSNNSPISGLGSLVLGGYDTSRVDTTKNLTVPQINNGLRSRILALNSISTEGHPLLNTSIYASLDSAASQIWLPTSVCTAFENAFNLTWNDASSLYLLTDDQHSALLASNPNVTFSLSSGLQNDSQTLNITLPYSAFDLNYTTLSPNSTTSVPYFPLKRASTSDQYTLGRTFLQYTYIIFEYQRNNTMTLYPAIYPANNNPADSAHVIPICPPDANSTTCLTTDSRYHTKNNDNGGGGLSGGAIAGIVIGVLLALVIAAGIACFFLGLLCFKKRKQRRDADKSAYESSRESNDKPEMSNPSHVHVEQTPIGGELEDTGTPQLSRVASPAMPSTPKREFVSPTKEQQELGGPDGYFAPVARVGSPLAESTNSSILPEYKAREGQTHPHLSSGAGTGTGTAHSELLGSMPVVHEANSLNSPIGSPGVMSPLLSSGLPSPAGRSELSGQYDRPEMHDGAIPWSQRSNVHELGTDHDHMPITPGGDTLIGGGERDGAAEGGNKETSQAGGSNSAGGSQGAATASPNDGSISARTASEGRATPMQKVGGYNTWQSYDS